MLGRICFLWICLAIDKFHIAHTACYRTFLLVHCKQVTLWPTVNRSVCLFSSLIWGPRQDLYYCQTLPGFFCGVPALTRGRVCQLLQLLLSLASAIILGCESCGILDNILPTQIREFPNLDGHVPVIILPRNKRPSYTSLHFVPFSLPTKTRRAKMEVFEPVFTNCRSACWIAAGFVQQRYSWLQSPEIHDQDIDSLLDMNVFRKGASSSSKEWSYLCRSYVCCTAVSTRAVTTSRSLLAVQSLSLRYNTYQLC
jgi:hypothetical protein